MGSYILRIDEVILSINQKEYLLQDKLKNILNTSNAGSALKTEIKFDIVKKSIDSRDKSKILFVYSLNVFVADKKILSLINKKHIKKHNIRFVEQYSYEIPKVNLDQTQNRPVVVGSGPSGLFAALLLAEAGLKPILIERGKDVDSRIKDVDTFSSTGKLNINSNVQFGEGGAGTFSDGKLYTGVNDSRSKYIFEELVLAGAPSEIVYDAKPHIGTDKLRGVVKQLRKKIIDLGGEVRFNTCLTDINLDQDKLSSIILNNTQELKTDDLVLAIGHSARDTYQMIYDKGLQIKPKTFAIGLRIEHSREMINKSQFGAEHCNTVLPTASYRLVSHQKENRSVYSFCMCPGGYVIASSSEEGRLVVNGMSEYAQNSDLSNSALLVSVEPSDFGSTDPLAGVEFQRKREEAAFIEGGSNYNAPVQLVGDFLKKQSSKNIGSLTPSYKPGYKLTSLDNCLPTYVASAIREALPNLDKKIKGFANPDAVLTGIESRSSSPIRIVRDENFQSNILGIYPTGEGAGYAGGITSSAIDGIKVAEKIIEKYISI